jgi:hypothetical protein
MIRPNMITVRYVLVIFGLGAAASNSETDGCVHFAVRKLISSC